jgi:hypothetical protein
MKTRMNDYAALVACAALRIIARRSCVCFKRSDPSLGGQNELFHVAKDCWILHLFAQLFQEGLNLSEEDKHLTGKAGLEKQFAIQRSVQHEGSGHLPVSARLAKPGIFLGSQRGCDFQMSSVDSGQKPSHQLRAFRSSASRRRS